MELQAGLLDVSAVEIESGQSGAKKYEVNPLQKLKYILQNIMTINHKNIRNLNPQNYKKLIDS